jgi:hypothetical protein
MRAQNVSPGRFFFCLEYYQPLHGPVRHARLGHVACQLNVDALPPAGGCACQGEARQRWRQ